MSKSLLKYLWILMTVASVTLASSNGVSSCHADEEIEDNGRQLQQLLRTEGLDVVSPALRGGIPDGMKDQMLPPEYESREERLESRQRMLRLHKERANANKKSEFKYFREQLSQQIEFLADQGNDVQKLRELVERLQRALENAETETTRDVKAAVFSGPGDSQQRPAGNPQPTPEQGPGLRGGSPNFKPPMMRLHNRDRRHPGRQPELHHLDIPFTEDQQRIAALVESAERLERAGLPEIAVGLRERAGHLERELDEKRERIQRERAQTQVRENRREGIEGGDHSAPPIRELHEQLNELQREMRQLSEQMEKLTELIQGQQTHQRHRRHQEDMDDDDDRPHEDDEHHQRNDRDENGSE